MKKITTMMTAALVCGVMFTSCGGGTPKSGLKNNEFFGNLPALHADFDLAKGADEAELEKVWKSSDPKKIAKAADRIEKRATERKEKFDAAVEAEWAKVQGRSLPISFSKAANEIELIQNIEIASAKIEGQQIVFNITAKNDIPRRMLGSDRNWVSQNAIYFRFVAKDGSTLYSGVTMVREQNYTAGQSLAPQFGNAITTQIFPAHLADFTNIEIISKQEYDNLQKR